MQCPRCAFENDPAGIYCQQCGTYLQTSTPSPHPQAGFPIPPPPPLEYSTAPSISSGMHVEIFSHQQMVPSRPPIPVFRVMRSMLYFIAIFIATFGLIGAFNALFGTGNRAEGLAIFFGLGLLIVGVVIFLRMRHRVPQLRVAHFLWGILSVTVGLILALILAFALAANPDLSFGYIILIYGVILAATSLW
jgi:hypothetical protein